MKSVALGFEHISKSYGDIPVIKDLSLAIMNNVTTAIVGTNDSDFRYWPNPRNYCLVSLFSVAYIEKYNHCADDD